MKTIEVIGHVSDDHRLLAEVPDSIAPGQVRVKIEFDLDVSEINSARTEDEGEWAQGVAAQWAEEWNDPREDIYSEQDGEPVNGIR